MTLANARFNPSNNSSQPPSLDSNATLSYSLKL